MPDANVDVVRAQFEATNRRDFQAAMDAYAEDVVLVAQGFLQAGTFRGRKAVGEWFGEWFRAFAPDYRFEIEEARAIDGDRVFLVAQHLGRGRASGAAVEGITAYVHTVVAGKITRVELYADTAEAAKAAGLEDDIGERGPRPTSV